MESSWNCDRYITDVKFVIFGSASLNIFFLKSSIVKISSQKINIPSQYPSSMLYLMSKLRVKTVILGTVGAIKELVKMTHNGQVIWILQESFKEIQVKIIEIKIYILEERAIYQIFSKSI